MAGSTARCWPWATPSGCWAGRWDLDAYLGVWLYTTNADFFPGGVPRSQDPVLALQGHVSYTFRPGLWLAGNATWFAGGASQIGDRPPADGFNNSRMGLTLSLPMGRFTKL